MHATDVPEALGVRGLAVGVDHAAVSQTEPHAAPVTLLVEMDFDDVFGPESVKLFRAARPRPAGVEECDEVRAHVVTGHLMHLSGGERMVLCERSGGHAAAERSGGRGRSA